MPPPSMAKGHCDYIGLTQVIQDNLPILRISHLSSICKLEFLLPCDVTFTDSRDNFVGATILSKQPKIKKNSAPNAKSAEVEKPCVRESFLVLEAGSFTQCGLKKKISYL